MEIVISTNLLLQRTTPKIFANCISLLRYHLYSFQLSLLVAIFQDPLQSFQMHFILLLIWLALVSAIFSLISPWKIQLKKCHLAFIVWNLLERLEIFSSSGSWLSLWFMKPLKESYPNNSWLSLLQCWL